PVGGDLSRRSMGADRIGEERSRRPEVTLLGHEHVDDLPVLVNGPVDVSPGTGDLHIRLIDEPVTTHAMAAWPGRVDEQGREPLDPPEQGHVVDVDATLGKQFLQIPVRQPVAQVPTHGEQDDLRREPKPSEGCPRRLDGSNEVSALHSLQPRLSTAQARTLLRLSGVALNATVPLYPTVDGPGQSISVSSHGCPGLF